MFFGGFKYNKAVAEYFSGLYSHVAICSAVLLKVFCFLILRAVRPPLSLGKLFYFNPFTPKI